VHIEAIGAAIDLGCAHFHELDQDLWQAGAGEIDFDRAQRLVALGRNVWRRQAFGVHGMVLVHRLAQHRHKRRRDQHSCD
jgi:hypothetical protein